MLNKICDIVAKKIKNIRLINNRFLARKSGFTFRNTAWRTIMTRDSHTNMKY